MKYGVLLRNYGTYSERIAGYNVGDAVQDYTLLLLYERMGIPKEEIVPVRLDELHTYSGEYVLLPMFGFGISDIGMGALPLSPRIIPLFSSSVFIKTGLTDECISYLRHFEPIGCRDEFSMNALRAKGLMCTLTGCITMTLPRRTDQPRKRKVFLVDISDEMMRFIPEPVRRDSERITHLLPLDYGAPDTDEAALRYYNASLDILNRYKNEATLVISSRLHAIAPCLAMGVPVIALTENITQRFSWLDKYLPIYSEENADQIDWNPKPLDMESEKEAITRFFMSEISSAYAKWGDRLDLSMFYETRQVSNYGSRYVNIIRRYMESRDSIKYAIWGCGLIGENVYQIMTARYPGSECVAVIDTYVRGTFHGLEIQTPKALPLQKGTMLFLASYSGRKEALSRMMELSLHEGEDYIYLATQNG